jgi:hypothetical protein
MDPDVSKIAQVLAAFGGFLGFVAVLVIVVRAASWKMRSSKRPTGAETPRIDDSRFTRLEEAVDSIAIEVERIAEAQRFSAKLMSERLPSQLPDSTVKRLPGQ